jgi:hypothetical protein
MHKDTLSQVAQEKADAKLYQELFGPLEAGVFHELTDEDWARLKSGRRTTARKDESLAVPARLPAG